MPYVDDQILVQQVVLERRVLGLDLLDLVPNHVPFEVHEGRLRVQEAREGLEDVRERGLG